jgi:hypothetical protein
MLSYPVAAYCCSLMAASTTMRASPVGRGILQQCDATTYHWPFRPTRTHTQSTSNLTGGASLLASAWGAALAHPSVVLFLLNRVVGVLNMVEAYQVDHRGLSLTEAAGGGHARTDTPAARACSFQRCSFTPTTRSHAASRSSDPPGIIIQGDRWAAKSGARKVVNVLIR